MSERLRSLRTARNYSRDAIADAIGMGRSTLSEWEAHPPKALDYLARLSQRYGVTADYILGLTPPSLPPGAQPLIEAVSHLSADGYEDLLEAVRRVVEEDRQRQEDMRVREAYAHIADHILDDNESELLARAIALARSGDMGGAVAVINDIVARFRDRLR